MAKNGDTKWDNAVAKATGQQPAGSDAPSVPTMAAMVKTASQADIEAILGDPSLEFAPQVRTLEEGEMVYGVLVGYGPQTDFEDKDTGVTRIVNTWIIASLDGRMSISILSSAQLERKLPPYIGGPVKIVRGKDLKTNKGFRVTDYLVAGPKLEGGKRREFATLRPPAPMIEASATVQAALPAPSTPDAMHREDAQA